MREKEKPEYHSILSNIDKANKKEIIDNVSILKRGFLKLDTVAIHAIITYTKKFVTIPI